MEQFVPMLVFIGRILFGGFWIYTGIQHFTQLESFTGYTRSKGVPSPKLATVLTGIMIVLAGAAIVLGVYIQLAVLLLTIFLIPVTFVMHNFWKTAEPNARMMDKVMFLKNMALLGASLLLLAIPEPWTIGY